MWHPYQSGGEMRFQSDKDIQSNDRSMDTYKK